MRMLKNQIQHHSNSVTMKNIIKTTESSEALPNGKATEGQIAVWKKQHGVVYEIEVKGYFCYIREFDRETMKYALSQLNMKINTETQEAEFDMDKLVNLGEVGLNTCWLGGDEEIKTSAPLFISACLQVGTLFEIADGTLKKL